MGRIIFYTVEVACLSFDPGLHSSQCFNLIGSYHVDLLVAQDTFLLVGWCLNCD